MFVYIRRCCHAVSTHEKYEHRCVGLRNYAKCDEIALPFLALAGVHILRSAVFGRDVDYTAKCKILLPP